METDELDRDSCLNQKSHFEHKEEAMRLLETLTLSNVDVKQSAKALAQLTAILELYQEQSHLLDPHLEYIIQPTMTILRKRIDVYQTDKAALDKNTTHLFRFLYLLTKTRGYKTIVKFMSHEVTDLEPVFHFLFSLNSADTSLWEVRYVCFIWLSLICMIPFDLKRIDSGSQNNLITNMLDLCKKYLKTTGKERDGAALLVARLLSRQDICQEYLIPFVEGARESLSADADVFETTGYLQALCIIYRLAPRNFLLPTLEPSVIPLLTMPFFDKFTSNAVIRKLRTKLAQRAGLCFLKPKVAAWRYQRGNRSLRQNLEISSSVAAGLVSAKANEDNKYERTEEDDEEEISDDLEIIIELLLNGLRDKDTIVRWSAAKGIGRITQRLPQELAEDVVGSVLELFEENTLWTDSSDTLDLSAVSDFTWHGASLAIAELARRGLLLPARLKDTLPWIIRGLKFDIKRGSHSIGAHVRDACCYVCWAFARAYAPDIMEPFVKEIAQNLVVVSVFDREINIRRASSAAFQENVGRQGIFPHGIDIIQKADYFSLGNRNNAFLEIAFDIAKFDEYRYHLIQHLIVITAKHWDKALRVLASKSLGKLVALDPKYFLETVLPYLITNALSNDMHVSHGAMLAIAEICMAIYSLDQPNILQLYKQKTDALITVISKLPPKSLKTFGSEHIREAACQLIASFAKSRLSLEHKQDVLVDWKNVIYTSLQRKEETVQAFAVVAFGAVAEANGFSQEELDIALQKVNVINSNYYERRGYALALGTLDYSKQPDNLHKVCQQLCQGSQAQDNSIANDAESKRNAVQGLHSIFKKLGDDIKSVITFDDFQYILNCLQVCLTDYSIDQRGDVGSWVRVSVMELLNYLVPCVSRLDSSRPEKPPYLTTSNTRDIIAALLKQSVERIDKVRSTAGRVLFNVISSCDNLIYPGKEFLRDKFQRALEWLSPSDMYLTMVQILDIPEYRFELLTGLITSAGGLTESLVRHSSACLIEYTGNLPLKASSGPSLQEFFTTLLNIFVKYDKDDRIIQPLLDVTGLLYATAILSRIPDENLHVKLFTLVKKQVFKCKAIRKLLSAIKVFVGFLNVEGSQIRTKTLQQLLTYLIHPFPRIRIETSDQLFSFLSSPEDADSDELAQAVDIITSTDWTKPLNEVKLQRDQLHVLLKIPKPKLVKKS
ncbi:armadillo-type protein [Mycotypha africana]|uniref:armadillo-type protein n=1 Tax=Mycotypha africana TaxID=64632 RepID=UPI002301264A|nr:armadillo-type protein [Mycotypha africana]KAI8970360.1 armadillo-type protein [Mycotypha africana]